MEYLFIYMFQLAEIANGLLFGCTVFGTFAVIGFIITAGIVLFAPDDFTDEDLKRIDKVRATLKNWVIGLFAVSILFGLMPTRQTLALFGAMFLSKKASSVIVNDTKIQKVNTIIELQLDKYVKELQDEIKSNEK